MSCNGCRVLRKGCSDTCALRPCLQWIQTSEAQGHATVFVAKFFGRAGLMGLISAVPEYQRSALFQSLLYEACGRTVNPVFGAVGLLSSENWQICQAAVDTVLEGGCLRPSSPSSLSTCLPANPNFSAPCDPSALAMFDQKCPFPSTGRVEDPSQMATPLPSNVPSAAISFDRPTMSPGVGLPEAIAQEPQERSSNSRANNANNNVWRPETVHVDPTSTRQNDGQCEIQNECSRELLGHGLQGGVHSLDTNNVAPRRVRARLEASPVTPLGSGERSAPDELSVPAHGAEQLELDLTLNLNGERGEKMVGTKRLASPCDSLNSEGSVTSLDSTTLREPFRPRSSRSLEMSLMPPSYSQLLPLML